MVQRRRETQPNTTKFSQNVPTEDSQLSLTQTRGWKKNKKQGDQGKGEEGRRSERCTEI